LEIEGGVQNCDPNLVWGCNFSIRKELLIAANGFHPDGMPKELIRFRGDGETHVSRFVAKTGMKTIFHPGASVFHKVTQERMTFEYFRQRGFNHGISDSFTNLRSQKSGELAQQHRLISVFKPILRGLRDLGSRIRIPSDTRRALTELKLGYSAGWKYHQEAYYGDPEVHDWVHQSKYY
ncbi:MAG: hypothetical protein ACKN9V_10845, partial [Pseudomonadota bacterium]